MCVCVCVAANTAFGCHILIKPVSSQSLGLVLNIHVRSRDVVTRVVNACGCSWSVLECCCSAEPTNTFSIRQTSTHIGWRPSRRTSESPTSSRDFRTKTSVMSTPHFTVKMAVRRSVNSIGRINDVTLSGWLKWDGRKGAKLHLRG